MEIDLKRILRKQKVKVGDLVNHLLYGREWLAVVLKTSESKDTLTNKEKALVQMVPGSRYENFFKKYTVSVKISESQGWVSCNWLLCVEDTQERRVDEES